MRIIYLVRSYLVRACAYQGVRNISFSENFAKVINEWSHTANVMFKLLDLTQWFPFFLVLSGGSNGRVGQKKINHFKGTFLYVKNHIYLCLYVFICLFLVKTDLHSANVCRATVRQDLWACTVSVVAQDHMFLLHSRDWKKVQPAWTFFSVAGTTLPGDNFPRGQFFGHLVNSCAMFQIREAVGRSQMFFKIGALKNFTNFTGKQLC